MRNFLLTGRKLLVYVSFYLLLTAGFIFNVSAQEFGTLGQEVSRISNTGHQVQVWQVLPEYTENASYEVKVKHAVAGKKGSFYIIAWVDTNNDDKPDREIGRSGLKTANQTGEWSSWTFKSDYDKIFVGNTWSQSDEEVYYQSGGSLSGYEGLSTNVYYSRSFNSAPNQITSPRFTNIKVRILNADNTTFGVMGQEVSRISNTGHQVQVWQVLPEFTKNASYEVKVKHAVAGKKGSFYIIAWVDTNNDDKPDREIGRSGLKTANQAGEWSSWTFKSNYSKIFVGNTWSQGDEEVYYQSGGSLPGYEGLSTNVYYSRSFNSAPKQITSPRFTNIKVTVID
jgi:hypothetical protein